MAATDPATATPVLPALVAQVEAAVRAGRAGDPFRPVHILVPNHVLGTLLERALCAGTGSLAIHVELPHEFAWTVAARDCLAAGLLPVPEDVDLAIVAKSSSAAAADPATPAYLSRAVTMPGFAPAALATLRDIAAADVDAAALDAFAPNAPDPGKLRMFARLTRGYRDTLGHAGLIDRESLYRRAAALLPAADGAVVIVIGDLPPSRPCEAFIARLAATHPFAWLNWRDRAGLTPRRDARRARVSARMGLAPDATPDMPSTEPALSRLQTQLFAESAPGEPTPLDVSVRVLSAAGEALEAVEIARLIQDEAARGVRFHEMAVLVKQPEAYAMHLASAFDRADIPAYFLEGVPRVDPAARALGVLLGLLDADLDRARVAEFLTTARVRYRAILPPGVSAQPDRWDRLSAEAGIVSGLDRWRKGLDKARQDAAKRKREWDILHIDALRTVIERLASDLAAFPSEGSWGAFLDATLSLFSRWIQDGKKTAERLERVIAPLDRFAPAPSRDQFLARVQDLIATQIYVEGSLGESRVFVGKASVARGLRFRVVFVPGMVERRFPSVARPDPLLLDDERVAIGEELRTTGDRQEEERVEFMAACAAAGERLVLSYPRVEGQSGRALVPSSFLLRAARAAVGARVSAEDLAHLASAGQTALGRPCPTEPAAAIDRIERDLAMITTGARGSARHLLDLAPSIGRVLAADRAAWIEALTPWDGVVDVEACAGIMAKLRVHGSEMSATAIETLSACPYRHLLRSGLGLRKWKEPERAYAMEAVDAGSILHGVYERLFGELKDRGELPITAQTVEAVKRRARTLLDDGVDAFTQAGGVVNRSLLDAQLDQMRANLDGLIEREPELQQDFVPDRFELAFTQLPFEFAPGRSVTFHGYMDRLDVAAGPRRVRVIDYKTGKYFWKDGDQFRGGRNVQLAIYVLAAAAAYPGHDVADSRYYYSTDFGRFRAKAIDGTEATRDTLRQVLTTLDDTVAEGVFAPVADQCDHCDFDGICGPHRQARAARKKDDPRLAAFQRMRAIK